MKSPNVFYESRQLQGNLASTTAVRRLLNALMKKGKKSTAEKIVYRLCEAIETKEKKKSLLFIFRAIRAVRPLVGWSDKQGGRRKSRPIPLSIQAGERLAIK